MPITVYTTSSCPFCKQEKEYLTEKGVEFEKVVLDQQPEKLAEYRQFARSFSGVPLTVVPGSDDTVTVVKGFNKKELDETLSVPGDENRPGLIAAPEKTDTTGEQVSAEDDKPEPSESDSQVADRPSA